MADNIFVLDDGTKEITINNKFGEEICKIHIRSGDISILDRYNEFTKDISEIVAPLQNVKLNNDGTSAFDDDWKVIKEVEKQIIDRINSIFDTKDAGKLFEKRNAFSTVGGAFYVEKVIDMLGTVVAQDIEQESKNAQKRIEKYMKDVQQESAQNAPEVVK